MNAYDLYKPLRNYLRAYNAIESLAVLRAYFQNLQFSQPLPEAIQVHQSYTEAARKQDRLVFEWELEILAKEVILNGQDIGGSKSLRHWPNFANAVNALKKLEDEITKRYGDIFQKHILLELYRIAHRQFPWQQAPNSSALLRSYKIFSGGGLDAILQDRIGMSASQLYTLGLAFSGHYIGSFSFDYPPTISIPGIDAALVERFCRHFSTEMPTLRKEISDRQSYDEDYPYTLNPLRITPLVRTVLNGKSSLIAPVPTYLFRRFTEGIYYELYDDQRFAAAFGHSFASYVGDVFSSVKADDRFAVFSEKTYIVGKDEKLSIDWLVADDKAALFIECKTKRVRYDAKIALADLSPLEDDLDKMAGFIVQAYRTQLDCEQGFYPHWKPSGQRIFPIIVTLEDWYTFGDRLIAQELDRRVAEKLVERGIDPKIAERSPYTVCCVAELELAIQIMKEVGIADFMMKKTSGEHRLWLLQPFMLDLFPVAYRGARRDLFHDEYARIHPSLGHGDSPEDRAGTL